MGFAKVNGLDILQGRIALSRYGAWTGDLIVDAVTAAQVAVGGPAVVTYGDSLTFNGSVTRSGDFSGSTMLRLVGGTGLLGEVCQPRFYQGVPLSAPLADVLGDAGMLVSATADPNCLGFVVPFWTMVSQPVGVHLSMLCKSALVGCTWRVLADGSVFFGVDGFAPASTFEFDLLEYPAELGYQLLHSEAPAVVPGQGFNAVQGGDAMNVSLVEHLLSPTGSLVKVWFET